MSQAVAAEVRYYYFPTNSHPDFHSLRWRVWLERDTEGKIVKFLREHQAEIDAACGEGTVRNLASCMTNPGTGARYCVSEDSKAILVTGIPHGSVSGAELLIEDPSSDPREPFPAGQTGELWQVLIDGLFERRQKLATLDGRIGVEG